MAITASDWPDCFPPSRYKDENWLLEHATEVFPHTLMADEGLTVKI